MVRVLGVDGCPRGWVGALVSPSGRVRWCLLPDATAVLGAGAAVTGIDIPIGLPAEQPRACDVAARRVLGHRGSTVFPAPVRATLAAETYGEACELARQRSGKAISRQAWNLVSRIADVDHAITPARQATVIEVHPEVSYALMAGHARPGGPGGTAPGPAAPFAALPAKRTREGVAARLRALTTWLDDPEAALAAAPPPARTDDALDALAAAWSARRWLHGRARVLPPEPPRDQRGLRMEIVA